MRWEYFYEAIEKTDAGFEVSGEYQLDGKTFKEEALVKTHAEALKTLLDFRNSFKEAARPNPKKLKKQPENGELFNDPPF